MPLAVNEQSAEIAELAREWALVDALMGGTPAMREAGELYLPRWPNELPAAYETRLSTATLFPAFRRTVGVMAGKPFAKELTLSDETPAQLRVWAEDIDLQGVSLHTFAAEMFEQVVAWGMAGILVEYPDAAMRDEDGNIIERTLTRAQMLASGHRPYFVRIGPHQILGWRSEQVGGRTRLTQLRLLETVDEPDGGFGTVYAHQVRVLYPGGWEIYRQPAEGAEWQVVRSGRTALSEIPFVPLYGDRKAFMQGLPPLIDLAYQNVEHWQSKSDQQTILHTARVPILAVSGVDDEDFELVIGASAAVRLPMGADLKYVEHTGAAIEKGAAALEALQASMVQTGAELLVSREGQRTATESANDAEANKSQLLRMAEGFEDALDQALQFMADYVGLPSGGNVSLFKDYGATSLSDASAQLVQTLQGAGVISKRTAINEFKRRGVLAQEVDADDEADLVASSGDGLGLDLSDGNGT